MSRYVDGYKSSYSGIKIDSFCAGPPPPVYIKIEVEAEDRLNQCLIVLEISPDCHKESSNLLNLIEVDAKTLEKPLEDKAL